MAGVAPIRKRPKHPIAVTTGNKKGRENLPFWVLLAQGPAYFFFSSFLASALGAGAAFFSSFLSAAIATKEVEAIAPAITAATSFLMEHSFN